MKCNLDKEKFVLAVQKKSKKSLTTVVSGMLFSNCHYKMNNAFTTLCNLQISTLVLSYFGIQPICTLNILF